MKKFLRAAAASGVAAATLAGGLAFGPAAVAAPTEPQGSHGAETTANEKLPFVMTASSTFYAMNFNRDTAGIDATKWQGFGAAERKADKNWTFPAAGTSGKIRDSRDCLYLPAGFGNQAYVKYKACDNLPAGSTSDFARTLDGHFTVGNYKFAVVNGNTLAVVDGGGGVTLATSPGSFQNGGIQASTSATTPLERGKAVEVPVAIKTTDVYDDLNARIELTAPAGTTFEAGQTVRGEWANAQGTWSSGDLALTDVTVSEDGTKLEGTIRQTYATGFAQWKGFQLRWLPKVVASANALGGDLPLAYKITGRTELGPVSVSSSSPTSLDIGLSAEVTSTDVAEGSATLTGKALPNAWVRVNGDVQNQVQANDDGDWSYTVRGLPFGSSTLTVAQFDEHADPAGEITVPVDLAVAPLSVTPSFEDDIDAPAQLAGAAHPGAVVNVYDANGRLIGTNMAIGGEWKVLVGAPDAPGAYPVKVEQLLGGRVAGTQDATIEYGEVVSIEVPDDGFDVEPGKALTMLGFGEKHDKGQPAARIKVTEKGKPQTVLASGTVSGEGNWQVRTPVLDDREYTLVVTQTGRGGNVTQSEVVVNEGKGTVVAPTARVVFDEADVSKKATVTGTAVAGSTITVKDGTKVLGTVPTVPGSGEWSLLVAPVGPGSHTLTIEQTGIDGTQTATTVADYGPAVAAATPAATVDSTKVDITGTGTPGATVSLKDSTGKTRTDTIRPDGSYTLTGWFRPDATKTTVEAHSKGDLRTYIDVALDVNVVDKPITVTSPTEADAAAETIKDGDVTFTGTATPFSTVQFATWPDGLGRTMFTTYADENGNWTATGWLGKSYYKLVGVEYAIGGYTNHYAMFPFSTVAFQPLQLLTPGADDVVTAGDSPVKFSGTATPGATVNVLTWLDPRGRVVTSAQADGDGKWTAYGYLAQDNPYALKAEQVALNGKTSTAEFPTFTTESFHAMDQIATAQNGNHVTFTLRATPSAEIEIWTGPKDASWARKIGTAKADGFGHVTVPNTWLSTSNVYKLKIYQTTTKGATETVDYDLTTAAN